MVMLTLMLKQQHSRCLFVTIYYPRSQPFVIAVSFLEVIDDSGKRDEMKSRFFMKMWESLDPDVRKVYDEACTYMIEVTVP